MEIERVLFELRNLIDTMPNFHNSASNTPEGRMWLGRAAAMVEAGGSSLDAAGFVLAMDAVIGESNSYRHGQAVSKAASILFRTFARVESQSTPNLQGAYIPAGNSFDALAAIARVFSLATTELFIVDPYSDEKLLRDFAPLAAENVLLKILVDPFYVKSSLKPAVERWQSQFQNRPLEARLTSPRQLHDRLIIVDDKEVWIVTQSFAHLAERAPASVTRFESEAADSKIGQLPYHVGCRTADINQPGRAIRVRHCKTKPFRAHEQASSDLAQALS
ncbi:hypothetical protein [Bradyrhizobium sp. 17]|uniref:hypothetical protein n=1 Tax=Bradyrhizobium sp. 17 TaxID=2782649 RepID=UPI001FFA786B|nr:hypothetical protein [Bradyrhizobium sp. 17]MCK1521420.1 hypothetical protein [Bradyrhizobium sp. 17]